MDTHYESSSPNPSIVWLQACVRLSRAKKSALETNNLDALENCIEEEGRLLEQRPAFGPGAEERPLLAEWKAINAINRALVRNGMEFSSVLLEAIRPEAVYGVNGEVRRTANDTIFSAEG
ncbi:MAG TPA: hypothetical protein VFY29_11815 [Terriglobia bacterium]|nr:hypothetical protein [Terriglobia bacterium]